MFKFNNQDTRKTSLTWSDAFIENFEHIFLSFSDSIVGFKQVTFC